MREIAGREMAVTKGRRVDRPDRMVAVLLWLAALCIIVAVGWIVGDLVIKGYAHLSFSFLLEAPLDAGRSGGIGTVLVSTLLILAACFVVSIPVGIGTAVLLAEYSRQSTVFNGLVRRSLDVLAGVPSIVFGLFGNAFFSIYLGLGFSILSGGLTLACMTLPIVIRSTEVSLRSVTDDYRRAAAALAVSRSETIWRILLPAATPGVVVGYVLGVGRALSETAALLYTSGYVDRMPLSLLDSGRSLSIHIYDLAMNVPGGQGNAYASALVLIISLLTVNGLTSWIADRWLQGRIARV